MQDRVKWFNAGRGYGFTDGRVFVHAIDVVKKSRPANLGPGDTIEFENEKTDKGDRARKVRLVKKAE